MKQQYVIVTAVIGIIYLVCLVTANNTGEDCSCSCVKTEIPTTIEEQEELIEQETERIKEELYVEKESLSSNVRKKSSADDERPSAQNVGYMGVAMLGLAGGLIIVMDVNYIIQIGYKIYNKLPCFHNARSTRT